jgi:hypothetical protein
MWAWVLEVVLVNGRGGGGYRDEGSIRTGRVSEYVVEKASQVLKSSFFRKLHQR